MSTVALEEHKYGRSFGLSFLMHALLLLIAFFLVVPNTPPVQDPPLPKEETYLVDLDMPVFKQKAKEVKFKEQVFNNPRADKTPSMGTKGRADEGASAPRREVPPPAPVPSQNPVPASTPEPVKPSTSTPIKTPDPVIKAPAPVLSSNDEDVPTTKQTPPTPGTKPATGPTTPNRTNNTTPTRVGTNPSGGGAPNSNGSTPGTQPGRSSSNGGTGTGAGNVGSGGGRTGGPDGSEGEGNTSSGTGAYDGSGDGVFGRKVVYRDTYAAKAALNMTGVVSVKICVNQAGIVTFTDVIEAESTIRDKTTLKNFLKAAKNYKVQPDKSAPKEQCGKLVFKTNNTVNNKLRG
jgi:hypothetical protein